MKERTVKISFIGDIMCESPLLKAARIKNGGYDFNRVFENTKQIFSRSDYVVGNLETVFAGRKAGYTKELYSFNTPDEFAEALKNSGIHLLTTANNHCLDRGITGLNRTLDILDEKVIAHTGTCRTSESRKGAFYKKVGDMTFAFLSYTYGTNYAVNHYLLPKGTDHIVNLLRPQTESVYEKKTSDGKRRLILRAAKRILTQEQTMKLTKLMHKPYNSARKDDALDIQTIQPFLETLRADIKEARENADFVLVCPHVGGQFNAEPGKFSEYVMDYFVRCGVDAVIGPHPHIVQKMEIKNRTVPCAFSLGNYSMSLSTAYILMENLPDYSIMLHLYVNKTGINKISFSILKIIEEKAGNLSVYPAFDLWKKSKIRMEKERLERDITDIYYRFMQTKRDCIEMCEEYVISELRC